MNDLITRERALRNLGSLSPSAADNLLIDALVAAVSRAAESHCRRTFALRRHDEWYAGGRGPVLLLRHYPIVSVERVATGARPVLRVANTAAGNERATVQVTDAGLTLTHVAAGAGTTTSFLFADYPTLAGLASAVDLLGSGWAAALPDPADGPRAAADLAPQGAYGCKDAPADLTMAVADAAGYAIDATRGGLVRDAGWAGGSGAWRVVYLAGYAAVPDDVQEACAAWVAALFWQAKRDPGLSQESLPGVVFRIAAADVPVSVRALLAPYRTVRL